MRAYPFRLPVSGALVVCGIADHAHTAGVAIQRLHRAAAAGQCRARVGAKRSMFPVIAAAATLVLCLGRLRVSAYLLHVSA